MFIGGDSCLFIGNFQPSLYLVYSQSFLSHFFSEFSCPYTLSIFLVPFPSLLICSVFFLLFLWDLTELYLHVLKFFYLYETLEQICSYAALLIKTMVKIVTQIFFLVVWTLLLFLLYLLSNMESFNVFGCNW